MSPSPSLAQSFVSKSALYDATTDNTVSRLSLRGFTPPHQFKTSIFRAISRLIYLGTQEPTKSRGQKIFEAYEKVTNLATTLFPLWTVLFTGIAIKSPQSFAWFTTEYFTGALAALMLSMGITLTPDDFKQVASRPSATLMQFALCYGMMPGLALALGNAFGLSKPLIAGLVLVGCINGGQASNLCTYIARGNVALSVLMTTATTLGAIFMTPLLCKFLLGAVVPVDAVGIAKSTIEVSFMYILRRLDICYRQITVV